MRHGERMKKNLTFCACSVESTLSSCNTALRCEPCWLFSQTWRCCRVNGGKEAEGDGEEGAEDVYDGCHGHRFPEISAGNHREHVVQMLRPQEISDCA